MFSFNKFFALLLIFTFFLTSCGGKFGDTRKTPVNAQERARKNVEEGKGFGGGGLFSKKKGGVFDFASSNELWRASLDTLDFMSFSNVDYSGGLIITDWYSETENQQSIKITVRFLSNEIRADGLKVTLHQRICGSNNSCAIKEVKSSLNLEVKDKILRKAALLKKAKEEKVSESYKNEDGEINWCADGRTIC